MKKITIIYLLFVINLLNSQIIDLTNFASGFTNPVAITNAGDSRLFVVERDGIIKILNSNGSTNSTPFINISSLVVAGGERGLLGLAFHPNYSSNGYFFVNYTRTSDGSTVISRFSRDSGNPNIANPSSEEIILTISQPFTNHNGGSLAFGNDGYLYISTGDGGSGGDPNNNGQNLNTLLGKILRINVDTLPYTIPADNPFVGVAGLDEIWAYGLRNPWKFSFNRDNDNLWIADVGQNQIEEINKASPTDAGLNYGWRCYEGNNAYNTAGCAPSGTMTFPYITYTHAATGGCSITGGYVYTGTTYSGLQNKYIFADYCSNKIGFIDTTSASSITWSNTFSGNFSCFGEDINGELYVAGISNGTIYRIIDSNLSTIDWENSNLSIYPLPFKDSFTIKNPKNLDLYKLVIIDLSGKTIANFSLNNNIENNIFLPNISSGIYLATFFSKSGESYRTKLIK